jgi:hypothetical protein
VVRERRLGAHLRVSEVQQEVARLVVGGHEAGRQTGARPLLEREAAIFQQAPAITKYSHRCIGTPDVASRFHTPQLAAEEGARIMQRVTRYAPT